MGRLFLGGIIPDLLMGFSLMILIYFYARARVYPKDRRSTFRQKCLSVKEAFLPLLMPMIML